MIEQLLQPCGLQVSFTAWCVKIKPVNYLPGFLSPFLY